MATLRPTDGWTACTIYTGKFSDTYDDRTTTTCCFHPIGSCLCEWYWDTPVNVTKLNLYTLNYPLNSDIYRIWGRVNGSWVELWAGTWVPSHAIWSSKSISCNNCDGIRIGQHLGSQHAVACINEVTVDYEISGEGRAEIVSVTTPSSFTPGVPFQMDVVIKNIGSVADVLFVRFTNVDTGKVLGISSTSVGAGVTAPPVSLITTLTQTTAFHWLVEAGHVED